MARRSEKQWKQIVREHDRSGLSVSFRQACVTPAPAGQ
jgi:hypothetical protein